jgi:hypothetical protein
MTTMERDDALLFFPGYPKPLASIFSIAIIHRLLMVDLAKKNKRALFLIRINKPNNKKQIKIHPPQKMGNVTQSK